MGNISDFFTLGRVSPFRNPSVLLQNSSRSSESLSHQSIYPSLNRDFIRYPPQKPPINESLGRKIIYRSWHFPWVFPMATKTWSPATALAAPSDWWRRWNRNTWPTGGGVPHGFFGHLIFSRFFKKEMCPALSSFLSKWLWGFYD